MWNTELTILDALDQQNNVLPIFVHIFLTFGRFDFFFVFALMQVLI